MRIQLSIPMLIGLCTLVLIATFPRSSPAQHKAAKKAHASTAAVKEETGTAVFYSDKLVGRPLTSGEKYDKNALTAAHRTLPLGTRSK